MSRRVLITGGAGFIGSHLADHLLRQGHRVRALDSLSDQVHGETRDRPAYLDPEVELQVGDVRNEAALQRALDGIDVVYHFAARVGVGQSMYEIADYISVNNEGTAQLLQALIHKPVERLIVASSMSIYGEGMYRNTRGELVAGNERSLEQLREHRWELYDDTEEILSPIPTSESKPPALSSIYALSKYDQERMCLLTGRAYHIPTVALRFFNVYGPRQALSNPYTGVLAIFASRMLNGNAPLIFEDGLQKRDFVNVHDVAEACRLAMDRPDAAGSVINIGSGSQVTVRDLADQLGRIMEKTRIEPEITGKYRVGDVRHCFADISLAKKTLGYQPTISIETGLTELAEWLQDQIAVDRVSEARAELELHGLTV